MHEKGIGVRVGDIGRVFDMKAHDVAIVKDPGSHHTHEIAAHDINSLTGKAHVQVFQICFIG